MSTIHERIEEARSSNCLNLRTMQLSSLPTQILELSRTLKELYLSDNPLRELPDWINRFEKLALLDVTNCNLTSFPVTILSMRTHLEFITFHGNKGFKPCPDDNLCSKVFWYHLVGGHWIGGVVVGGPDTNQWNRDTQQFFNIFQSQVDQQERKKKEELERAQREAAARAQAQRKKEELERAQREAAARAQAQLKKEELERAQREERKRQAKEREMQLKEEAERLKLATMQRERLELEKRNEEEQERRRTGRLGHPPPAYPAMSPAQSAAASTSSSRTQRGPPTPKPRTRAPPVQPNLCMPSGGSRDLHAADSPLGSSPSLVDMTADSHPPSEFTMKQWCDTRDALFTCGQQNRKDSTAKEQYAAVYRAGLAMNLLQERYGDMLSVVSHQGGRLFSERFLVFYLGPPKLKPATKAQAKPLSESSNERIFQLKGQHPKQVIDDLHLLREFGNRGDHDAMPDIRPEEKPVIAHCVFRLATILCRDALSAAPRPLAPSASSGHPSLWSVDDVSRWLRDELSLDESTIALVAEQEVDGEFMATVVEPGNDAVAALFKAECQLTLGKWSRIRNAARVLFATD